LQTLVDDKAHQKKNDFCVIGQKDGDYLVAYVYWKNEDELLLSNSDPEDYDASYALDPAYISANLKTDAVDHEHYVYQWDADLMPKRFAESILNACRRSGQQYSIIEK
jgi:hypothetical protein